MACRLQRLEVLDCQHLGIRGGYTGQPWVLIGDGLARQAQRRSFQQLIEQQCVGDEEEYADRNEPEAVLAGLIAQHQIQQTGGEVTTHLDAKPAADGQGQPGQQGMSQKQPGSGEGEQELDGLSDPQ
ncbi:hypothetical protein GCM10009412_10050 [Aeromonas salmonicida subsp. achromogenes]